MAKINSLDFVRQVRQEITRITWPTRKETLVTSMMVIVLSVIAAVFFLAVDCILSFVIHYIL